MNNSERILKILRRESVDRVVWAPRLEQWFEVNRFQSTLPLEFKDSELLEICDELGTAPRTYYFFQETIRMIQGGNAEVKTIEDDEKIVSVYSTPKGKLREVRKKSIRGLASYAVAPYWSEHMIKETGDLQALKYLLENQSYEFDRESYERAVAKVGDRGPPTIYCPAVPIANLTIRYAGLLKTHLLLKKHQNEVEDLLQTLDDNNQQFLEVLKKSDIPIVLLDDNIDRNLFSPSIFEKYILPYYKRRSTELHARGKICIAHWDGKLKSLLQYARETGLDGLECVTPLPQGDVTLEEIHSALGDMILTDGIPSILLLPWVKDSELEVFTRKLLRLFLPHLILGVADLVPPNANIEKIRLITKLIEEFQNN